MNKLIAVRIPETAAHPEVVLAVWSDDPQVIDGRLILGGLYVMDEGDDSALAGSLGIGSGAAAPVTISWTQDGYPTSAPAWADLGETLLKAFASGDELPEGWEQA